MTEKANGLVMMADLDRLDAGFQTVAEVLHPARASLADLDQDIAACAFHPFLPDDERVERKLDAVVWYEQIAPLSFERHAIEVFHVDCATLDLKDFDGDGDLDLMTGVFRVGRARTGWNPARKVGEQAPVMITWENLRIQ